MSKSPLGQILVRWALAEPSVVLFVQIGSRTRGPSSKFAADSLSDWDFQVATTSPELFADRAWTLALGLTPLAYVVRGGRLGSAQKLTALFIEGELDVVLMPAGALRGGAQLIEAGELGSQPHAMGAFIDLSAVLQGGYRILKGEEEFGELYRYVANRIPNPRLSDEAVCALAEGFVCDYISTLRKVERGELLAAQRWLHHLLLETNYRLLHELRLRNGDASLPDARRLEFLAEPRLADLNIAFELNRRSLFAAAERSASLCRGLMRDLVGERWQWPDLSALRLRAE